MKKNQWRSLAEFGTGKIKKSQLTPHEAKPGFVKFTVRYELAAEGPQSVSAVSETYEVTPADINVSSKLTGKVRRIKARLPVLVFDGQRTASVTVSNNQARITLGASRQEFTVGTAKSTSLRRTGDAVSCRNGYLEAIEGEAAGKSIEYKLRLGK